MILTSDRLTYSWIAYQLDNFESVTRFGFLIENYLHEARFFGFVIKPQNGFVWRVSVFNKLFSGGVYVETY